jgi:MFS family permease
MLVCVCAFGLGAQTLLYYPGSGMALATVAMILWLFAYGAISASSFVALAEVNTDPERAGIAAGLIGQIGSLACVAAPMIYFAVEHWWSFVLIAAAGLALTALLFPPRLGRPVIA